MTRHSAFAQRTPSSSSGPAMTQEVSGSTSITVCVPYESATERYLACGDNTGQLRIIELPISLTRGVTNEVRAGLFAVSARPPTNLISSYRKSPSNSGSRRKCSALTGQASARSPYTATLQR